ncbi:MAG TPA: glycosyltransferase family 2 protein [Gemmatimonadaceae bacterium]|nr:glycosyltransferase family 2 protein [Gemmatimonadaceae bacterium]
MPIAVLWLLPAISDSTSLVRGLLHRHYPKSPGPQEKGLRQHLMFLVPAHNESLLIGRCVRSLTAMSRREVDFAVVVVADNCDDDTSAVALSAGARVLQRVDLTRPGKPNAVQWALDQLPLSSFDAVTIIDADTTVEEGFADALARTGPLRQRAVQTYNGIANERESWLTCLGGLLVTVRYDGQFLLKRFAGLNCPMANGMTMGTDLLMRAGWAADSLTENWELYARWTALGERIDFAPDARLGSQEAKSLPQSSTQRRRWQAGRWMVFQQYAGSILRSSKIAWPQKIDALAELSAPGPVLHASIAVVLVAGLAFLPALLPKVVAGAFAMSLMPTLAWTAVAVRRQTNRGQLIRALARLPFYAVWRVCVAIMAVSTARRGVWYRSPRHASGPT